MEQYLQDEKFYEDRYDLGTIEECLDLYNRMKVALARERTKEEFKDCTDEEFDRQTNLSISIWINSLKMERFRVRKETISKWMDADRSIQDKYDKAVAPKGVLCKKCYSPTKVILKTLRGTDDGNSMILFGFECLKCTERQALFEDGSKWKYEPPQCPQCRAPLKIDMRDENDILITKTNCTQCSYAEEKVSDPKEYEESERKRKAKEQELLENYKKDFCFDEKAGSDAIFRYEQFITLMDEFKVEEEKKNDPTFQKAQQLKKLTLGQVEKLLEGPLAKDGYKDLHFGKPEMAKYVTIDFSLTDGMDERTEYNSQKTLKKLFKDVLEVTNWRLMSDGIAYRLGVLTGRLKAYEQDEDLIELVKMKVSKRQ